MRSGEDCLIKIRKIRKPDRPRIQEILKKTGVFTAGEVDIALELLDIALVRPGQKDYDVQVAVEEENILGYYCIGPTPLTRGTYDLYWIAVKPSVQSKGVGKTLLRHAEESVYKTGGRLLIAETSSQPKYENTRRFYIGCKYTELARIRDYYKIGDDLVVYGKYVSQSGGI